MDASIDSPPDANRADAAPLDAPDEGAAGDDWPGWRRLVELDAKCIVDIPKDISSVPPLTWIACPAEISNCQAVDVTGWLQPNAGTTRVVAGAWGAQNAKWLVVENFMTSTSWQITAYDVATNKALAAWRNESASGCSAFAMGGVTKLVMIDQAHFAYSAGTPTELMSAPKTFARLTPLPTGNVNGQPVASDTTLAIPVYPPMRIARVAMDPNTFVSSSLAALQDPVVWQDDVYAWEYQPPSGWPRYLRLNNDGSTTPFIDRKTRSVARLAIDGKQLWWIEADGSTPGDLYPTSVEVWTAPYSNDGSIVIANAVKAASFSGVRLTVANGAGIGVFNDIYYVFDGMIGTTYLVRGSDKKTKSVGPWPNYVMNGPVFVTQNELWGSLGKLPSGPGAMTLIRVQLGAW